MVCYHAKARQTKMDEKFLSEVIKCHGNIIADCLRRMATKKIRLEHIQFIQDDSNIEYLVCDRVGFQIAGEITLEGRVSFHAVPGHFSVLGGGRMMWRADPKDKVLYHHERMAG